MKNFRFFRFFAKNCEAKRIRFFSLYCEKLRSEVGSLRFASQKKNRCSLRFRFAFFFEKNFAFAIDFRSKFGSLLGVVTGAHVIIDEKYSYVIVEDKIFIKKHKLKNTLKITFSLKNNRFHFRVQIQ